MTNDLANFAGPAASVVNPLPADIIVLAWNAGDTETQRELASQPYLPKHLHRHCALHADIEVRTNYALNPSAEPYLLSAIAECSEKNKNLIIALISNPNTPDSAIGSLIDVGSYDIAISALQRQGLSRSIKAKACSRLAITSDPTTTRASRHLVSLLGSDPIVHASVLHAAPIHALGFVHAALAACGTYLQVQEAFSAWVDKYSNDLVRGDYLQLQAILVDFGSNNSISSDQRRWALGHLHAWKDRVLVEAISSHDNGEISILVANTATVLNALEYISHLAGRIPDAYLAGLVAEATISIIDCDQNYLQNAERHLRKIFNPVITGAVLQLEARGEIEAIILLLRLAGIKHMEALKNPWPVIIRFSDKIESIAGLEIAKLHPRRILEILQPLETFLRYGSIYMETMLQAIGELGIGSSAWHTAAVLAPTWQGNLLQLLHASKKLSADIFLEEK